MKIEYNDEMSSSEFTMNGIFRNGCLKAGGSQYSQGTFRDDLELLLWRNAVLHLVRVEELLEAPAILGVQRVDLLACGALAPLDRDRRSDDRRDRASEGQQAVRVLEHAAPVEQRWREREEPLERHLEASNSANNK